MANDLQMQWLNYPRTIINYCKPLMSASHERRSLHSLRRKFIKVAPATEDRIGSQLQPTACNAVKYAVLSKSRAHQWFV